MACDGCIPEACSKAVELAAKVTTSIKVASKPGKKKQCRFSKILPPY
jgi:hypothetical protein